MAREQKEQGPIPRPNTQLSAEAQDETVLMAMNIYAEARGQSDEGKSAVGQVVYNRVHGVKARTRRPVTWWGSGIKGVICRDKQFSWLNDRSSRAYNNAVNPSETSQWESCYRFASLTISGGGIADLSKGEYVADGYANLSKCSPRWATEEAKVCKIGDHTLVSTEDLILPGGAEATTRVDAGNASQSSTTTSTQAAGSDGVAQEGAVAMVGGFPNIDVAAAVRYNKSYGYDRDMWKAIQAAVGLRGNDVDGYVGPMTSKYIAKWQAENGFVGGDVDGVCGKNTLAAMNLGGGKDAVEPVSELEAEAVADKEETTQTDSSNENWQRPTQSNVVTSPFGPRVIDGVKGNHKGIDLRARIGDNYYAAADGKVTKAGGGDYNSIEIEHSAGVKTRYLHATSVSAKLGDVKAGDNLAASGGKGPKGVNQYAAHLHFEVLVNGVHKDPEPFLQAKGIGLSRKGKKDNDDKASMKPKSAKAVEEKQTDVVQGLNETKVPDVAKAPDVAKVPDVAKEPDAVDTDTELSADTAAEVKELEGKYTSFKASNATDWYAEKRYTEKCIKAIQAVVGAKESGVIDTETVCAIVRWQAANNLRPIDGMFGPGSAKKANIEIERDTEGDGGIHLLSTKEVNKRESGRKPKKVYHLATGKSFDVSWDSSDSYHTDFTPMTPADTTVIKSIIDPSKSADDRSWARTSSWGGAVSFTRSNGETKSEWRGHQGAIKLNEGTENETWVACGFHTRPHHNKMGGNPGWPLTDGGDKVGKEWKMGGHMCMYYGDSPGGTQNCNQEAKNAWHKPKPSD
ncbi:MAG: peptidoglycan DD-metalloendopeptidase family protein [Bradymonadales bacterium]